MDVPPDLNVPESIARLSPLSAEAMRTKRMEGISLLSRYLFWPPAMDKSFAQFNRNWANIKKDTLARRLTLHDIGKQYGLSMIEYVQFYDSSLRRTPPNSNGEQYLEDLVARGYFPEKAEEKVKIHAVHGVYIDSLKLYRSKLELPDDFVPHLRSWRLTDVPVDLEIPESFAYIPPISPHLKSTKRREKISLEFDSLFQGMKRRKQLQEFKANWELVEKNTLANRLALYAMQRQYGETMISNVNYYQSLLRRNRLTESLWTELGHDYIQTVFYPKEPKEKLKVYDAYKLYRASEDHYRARLGLSKEFVPHYVLKTARQRTD